MTYVSPDSETARKFRDWQRSGMSDGMPNGTTKPQGPHPKTGGREFGVNPPNMPSLQGGVNGNGPWLGGGLSSAIGKQFDSVNNRFGSEFRKGRRPPQEKDFGINPPNMPRLEQGPWTGRAPGTTTPTAGGPVPAMPGLPEDAPYAQPRTPQNPNGTDLPYFDLDKDRAWQMGRQQNADKWSGRLAELRQSDDFVDPAQDYGADWMMAFDPSDDVTADGNWQRPGAWMENGTQESDLGPEYNLQQGTELPEWAWGEAQHWRPEFQEAFADAWGAGNEVAWQRVRNLARAANGADVVQRQQDDWNRQWRDYNNSLAPVAPAPVAPVATMPGSVDPPLPPKPKPVAPLMASMPWLAPRSSNY